MFFANGSGLEERGSPSRLIFCGLSVRKDSPFCFSHKLKWQSPEENDMIRKSIIKIDIIDLTAWPSEALGWTPGLAGETILWHRSFLSFRQKPESSGIRRA